jgi:hypothetical protein
VGTQRDETGFGGNDLSPAGAASAKDAYGQQGSFAYALDAD